VEDGLIEGARVMDVVQIATVGWWSRNSVRACGEGNHVEGVVVYALVNGL